MIIYNPCSILGGRGRGKGKGKGKRTQALDMTEKLRVMSQ
jgi:hypothetical protein